MSNYILFTDSNCDLTAEFLAKWDIKCLDLTMRFEGEDREYANSEMDPKEFYAHMRAGKIAKTSAINTETFKEAFEAELKNGNDVLYLGFSSGLSNTCNAGTLAARELQEMYPDRKVMAVDTLAASAGQGLLVYLAAKRKSEGASIEEVAKYVEDNRLNLCHWFTVDDLMFLKRGGRVSPAVALIGSMLSIKPVLHVDNEGHLVKVGQARGRKASLKALADKYAELATDPKSPIFICHGDCADDVETLKGMLQKQSGVNVDEVVFTGTVIGAHSGPGTMALFFLGKER